MSDTYNHIISELCETNKNGELCITNKRLKDFIEKYGIDSGQNSMISSAIYYIHDFTDMMTHEQLYMFFRNKPRLIYQQWKNDGISPFRPDLNINNHTQNKAIDVINVILDCYHGDKQLEEWKNEYMDSLYSSDKYKRTFRHMVKLIFNNHDKRTKTFFELMRDRLIK